MYFIVETVDQLKKLEVSKECFLQVITNNNNYHPKLSKPSLFYYRTKSKGYILSVDHPDCFSITIEEINAFFKKHDTVYLIDKKYHSHFISTDNCVDMLFFNNKRYESKLKVIDDFSRKYHNHENLNHLVPVVKHYEQMENLYDYYEESFEQCRKLESLDKLVEAYAYVESNPISVKLEEFVKLNGVSDTKFSIDGNKVYTQYNLYNQTGRPTNTYNGVNFLAIPKDIEHRSCIVPGNDYLVEYDFDAYHLRIIANEVGYTFPKSSVHEYLGRQYFNKSELTEEEYKMSKSISFKNLYGSVPEAHQHIPFFNRMSSLANFLSESCAPGQSLELPTGIRLLRDEDMGPNKLLNYYVQNLETKYNVDSILKIKDLLKDKKTKLVLISYDAFLFDFSLEDGKQTLIDIKTILESNNMLTKHEYGKDYFFTK